MTDEVEQNVPGALTADVYTETLARLYFQQGFGPEALHIRPVSAGGRCFW